ncbi:MAG: CPBP family intramembrane metalloprotease [Clostridia bacterium]|nr:CPBP family intramembrane metalloprotease [Clostridia bacterium]
MVKNVVRIIKKIALALFYILIYFAFLYLLSWQVDFLEEDAQNYSDVVTILASIASLGVYLIILYMREKRVGRYIKIRDITVIDAVLSFMMAVGFRVLTGAYLLWSETNIPVLKKSIEGAQQGYNFNTMTTVCIISAILSVCLVAPVFEEILFRGFVLKELRGAMSDKVAILIQGLLFGLAHAALAQSLFAAVYGIILGAVYLRCRNLSVVIFSHIVFNVSSVLEVKNTDMLWQMFFTGVTLTGVSIVIFFYIHRRQKPEMSGKITGGN